MKVSISSAISDVSLYYWFIYDGTKEFFIEDQESNIFSVEKGEIFGIKIDGKNIRAEMAEDLGMPTRLTKAELNRLMKNAKPYRGKLFGKKVKTTEPSALGGVQDKQLKSLETSLFSHDGEFSIMASRASDPRVVREFTRILKSGEWKNNSYGRSAIVQARKKTSDSLGLMRHLDPTTVLAAVLFEKRVEVEPASKMREPQHCFENSLSDARINGTIALGVVDEGRRLSRPILSVHAFNKKRNLYVDSTIPTRIARRVEYFALAEVRKDKSLTPKKLSVLAWKAANGAQKAVNHYLNSFK